MSRQRVVSLHGLNTAGVWQRNVADLLEAHFSYDTPKYGRFRFLGFTKIAAGIAPLMILAYLIIMALVWYFGWGTVQIAGAISITALLLFLVARYMRETTVDDIAEALKMRPDEYPPHVVAHSLGTYLLIRALRKYPQRQYSVGFLQVVE